MSHPGEVKTLGFELILILIRIIILAVILILVSYLGLLLFLPAGIPAGFAGLLAGLVGFGLLIGSSLFEVRNLECPHCGAKTRVLSNFGTYRCSSCGNQILVQAKKTRGNQCVGY